MKLKLDENISRRLKPILEKYGHDVDTVANENLLSSNDVIIAHAASEEQRILLTLDVEFADLRKHPPGSHPGIIVFRPYSFGPDSVNKLIANFIRSVNLHDFSLCVVIVDSTHVRVRRPENT